VLLADEIARARRRIRQPAHPPQTAAGLRPEVDQGELDLSGIDDDAFSPRRRIGFCTPSRRSSGAASAPTRHADACSPTMQRKA
jgi:hypothetical protein